MGRESWASSPATRNVMQANRSRDTAAELAIRKELFKRGLRYRVDIAPVRGSRRRADIVFPTERVAVYVHGCFWHGCPEHYVEPKTNTDFWRAKRETNQRRDGEARKLLEDAGWVVIEVWEHSPVPQAAREIQSAVRTRQRRT